MRLIWILQSIPPFDGGSDGELVGDVAAVERLRGEWHLLVVAPDAPSGFVSAVSGAMAKVSSSAGSPSASTSQR